MYLSICKEPFTILTTAGCVILEKYTNDEEDAKGISLLSKLKNTPENWAVYRDLQSRAIKKPHGGQHGCRALTLAFERSNQIVQNAVNSRAGIITNVFDLSGLDPKEQVKIVNYLASEHSDVQGASKQKNFMDTMFVTRAYIQKVLGCKDKKELYDLLNSQMSPEEAEAERQQILEKLNPSSNTRLKVNSWSNATKFLRFVLQILENWKLWGKVNEMYKRFELKGQDKTKEALLAKYAKNAKGRGSQKKKKARKANRHSGKGRRMKIGSGRSLSSLLKINTSEGKDTALFRKIRDEDIPQLTQKMCLDVVTAGEEALVK
jgi:hypothetical protein